MGSEYKSEERRIDYIVGITPEQTETRKQKKRHNLRYVTSEQRERRNQWFREYRKNMTREQKERIRQYNYEYKKNMTPEQKEKHKQCLHEYKNNMTPEQRERKKQVGREYKKKFTSEQRERTNRMNRERYKRKKEEKLSGESEIQEKSTSQNVPGSDQNIKDRLFFCYRCKQQFVDNTNLLHHITIHISQPYVVVSKIDEYKKPLTGTELINMNMVIQKGICDNILTNTVYIKSEKCDDIKEEETEMDINEFPFCIPIKKELDIKIEFQNIK